MENKKFKYLDYNELSLNIFKSNNIDELKHESFIKSLRETLIYDFGVERKILKLLDNNDIIDIWFKYNSKEENRVGI